MSFWFYVLVALLAFYGVTIFAGWRRAKMREMDRVKQLSHSDQPNK